MQTCQGRHTVASYQNYLQGLHRLRLPFKVGLVEHGDWHVPRALRDNPFFHGYLIFLVPQPAH